MDFAWDFAKFWDGLCWACTGSEEFKIEAMNQQQKQHLQQVFNRLSGGDDKVVPAHLVAFMREYYANYVKEMSDTSSRRFREVEQEGFSLAVCNRRMAFEDFVAKELAALHDQEIKIVRHPGVDGTLTYFCGVAKDQSGDASELVSRDLRAEFCRIHAKVGSATYTPAQSLRSKRVFLTQHSSSPINTVRDRGNGKTGRDARKSRVRGCPGSCRGIVGPASRALGTAVVAESGY